MIEPVNNRSVKRLLYFKGSAPKESLDEMKAVHGEDAPPYDVGIASLVQVWW